MFPPFHFPEKTVLELYYFFFKYLLRVYVSKARLSIVGGFFWFFFSYLFRYFIPFSFLSIGVFFFNSFIEIYIDKILLRKVHNSVVLLYLQNCATITNFRTILSSQRKPCIHWQSFPLCLLPCSRQPLIYFLSLYRSAYSGNFHLSRIIQYMAFCDGLLSLRIIFLKFIRVIACVGTLFLFIAEYIVYPCIS